jgi:hypothetical protein
MVDGSIHFRKEKLGTVVSCYSMQYMGIWISELVTLVQQYHKFRPISTVHRDLSDHIDCYRNNVMNLL